MEEMAAKRNTGKDDDTAVSGISKRHRIRRKKSALAANAEEQAKLDWTNSIFQTVLNAEQAQWQRTIYSHVLNAEQNRESNNEAKALVESQRAVAKARLEKERQNELRAKKMDKIQQSRRALDEENISPDTESVSTAGGSSLKKMRDRRRKAALAKKAAQS
jgi:hypothetical protein